MTEWNLSDKITEDLYNCGEIILAVDDVREAVKELNKEIKKHFSAWEYMRVDQVELEIDFLFKEVFGEKLI